MEGPSWMPCQPGADLWLLMGGIVVENDVDGLVLRQLRLDGVEKADELLMAMTLHVAANHLAVEDVESRKQGGGAVALVIMGHRAAAPFLDGQARLCPIKCLDLAFFIDGQDNGMGWRRDV